MMPVIESVSVSINALAHRLPRRFRSPPVDPLRVRIYEWLVALPTMAAIAYFCVTGWSDILDSGTDLLVWGALQLSVDLLPISYSTEINQTMSLPVVLAAGMILPFDQVALVTFLACWDPRELTGRIALGRFLLNRRQIALRSVAYTLRFHLF